MITAALGTRLRASGLTQRALAAWATPRLSALPYIVPKLPATETAAGAVLELFVAGRELPLSRLGNLDLDTLHRAGLVDVAGSTARATVAVLPLGESLLVCDRLDTPTSRELVCWPDDSSYHLAQSLPSRTARWIDLGCGSAFAQLWRPQIAQVRAAADLSARAIDFAERGAALSGVALDTFISDLADGIAAPWLGGCMLVSCNAPIPDVGTDPFRPIWRQTDGDFIARVFEHASRLLAPDGMVVVHAAADALAPIVADLVGERVVVTYTPEGVPGFAVAWWRPDAPARLVTSRRDLTQTRPHLTFRDYEDAIAP